MAKRKSHLLIGKQLVSKYGENYTIISVESCGEVVIKYEDGTIVSTRSVNTRNGNTPNPNRPNTCGLGFTGIGNFTISENGKKTDAYVKWQSMFSRVYGIRRLSNKCYTSCLISPTWFNFQNFAKWFQHNSEYNQGYNEVLCLDKDLLNIGNTEYSPEKCCLIPEDINIAITLVTGFYYDKSRLKFVTKLTRNNLESKIGNFLGRYETESECLDEYSVEKDKYVLFLANKYKEFLRPDVYNALSEFNTKKRFLKYKE